MITLQLKINILKIKARRNWSLKKIKFFKSHFTNNYKAWSFCLELNARQFFTARGPLCKHYLNDSMRSQVRDVIAHFLIQRAPTEQYLPAACLHSQVETRGLQLRGVGASSSEQYSFFDWLVLNFTGLKQLKKEKVNQQENARFDRSRTTMSLFFFSCLLGFWYNNYLFKLPWTWPGW